MGRVVLGFSLLGLLAISGCGSDHRAEERTVEAPAPIVGGSPDADHAAVVAVLGQNFECSGTIVKVDGTTGYVLTAAHCCNFGVHPTKVVMGNDYAAGQTFPIIASSVVTDPCYQGCPGSTDDVCMLQFSGADETTPTLPLMTPQSDGLSVGAPITYVGYGETAATAGGNSLRRSVEKTIGSLTAYFVDYANPGTSGTCEGDSGGPGLVVVNGVEQVAAVTSYGDKACTQLGASIRVSSVYERFLAPYLAGTAPNASSCPSETDCSACSQTSESDSCGGDCSSLTDACSKDPACLALVTCYQGCSTYACTAACNTTNIDGLQRWEGVLACLCKGSCATACHDQLCVSAKCGTRPVNATASCGTCVDDTCCAEAWACSADAACKKCMTSSHPDASCAENANAITYYQCVNASCSSAGCTLADPRGTATTASAASSVVSSSSGAGSTGESSASGVGGGGTTNEKANGCAVRANARSNDGAIYGIALAALAFVGRRRTRRAVSSVSLDTDLGHRVGRTMRGTMRARRRAQRREEDRDQFCAGHARAGFGAACGPIVNCAERGFPRPDSRLTSR